VSLLAVQDVAVVYGKLRALERLSLHVEEGEVVALIGANGAGKSTLMKAVVGLVPLAAGTVRLGSERLDGRKPHEVARMGVALVPEGRATLRTLTVRENLVLGAFTRTAEERRAALEEVCGHFPILAERMDQVAGTLSGGEQQMLVIGRALMSRPKVMLLDEPSLGLAPLIARRILETVVALSRQGVTVLLVEQNAHAALEIADRAYVLENGRIVLEGRGLLGDRRVREAYLGELAVDSTEQAGDDHGEVKSVRS
jgi:branched-chain amino acid transport system ATP-binding protein